jgi:hypothetical protein
MADENSTDITEQPDAEVTADTTDEPKVYDQEYVSGIRKEAADHRGKAKALSTRLHTELVRATGRLADPTELDFDPDHLDDPDALNTAIDELLTRKPHYAARAPQGHVGQGVKDQGAEPLNLVTHLKSLV